MDVFRIRGVPVGQHVVMVVRHDSLLRPASPNLTPSDHNRNIDALGSHRPEVILQRRAFWRTREIPKVRLVEGRWNAASARDAG
jgi:hypothetical protein